MEIVCQRVQQKRADKGKGCSRKQLTKAKGSKGRLPKMHPAKQCQCHSPHMIKQRIGGDERCAHCLVAILEKKRKFYKFSAFEGLMVCLAPM